MLGPITRIGDPKNDDPEDNKKYKDFIFDYCFWSHDGFHADESGRFMLSLYFR